MIIIYGFFFYDYIMGAFCISKAPTLIVLYNAFFNIFIRYEKQFILISVSHGKIS